MKETPLSVRLAEMIDFLRSCEKECRYFKDQMDRKEKCETDLMHFIELDSTDYGSRAKLATQLRDCLQERRYFKDRVEERTAIAEFLSDPKNKGLLDALGRVLGEIRKVEKYHANRTYSPRVLVRVTKAEESLQK